MPLLLARVDDRLIHGQVVVGWAQALKANHICVINDEASKSEMQKSLFRMATPSEIKLTVMSVVQAVAAIKARAFDDDDVIVLFKNPHDALLVAKGGGRIGELNVGGMHCTEGKSQVCDAVFVNEADVECFNTLHEMKVGLEVRMVPTDSKKDLIKAIQDKLKKK